MNQPYDCLVVGCGFAGAVIARELAERGNKKVLLVEKHSHVGGNAYDCLDEAGVLIHKYGPHIFHTNEKIVFEYLSRFTKWREYMHKVVGNIHGKLIPIPFNLNSIHLTFDEEKAERLEQKLITTYGLGQKISILELRKSTDSELSELAEYIYQNVFLYYTQKQWGTSPNEIDPAVTARVPIFISRDGRYFQDKFQGVPLDGYTAIFDKMLSHPNIELRLSCNVRNLLTISQNTLLLQGKPFKGTVVYTGAVDELFDCCFGRLPYRTLDFCFETYNKEWYQTYGTVNYTVDQPFTRITEFKHLSGQKLKNATTIVKEYSKAYTGAHDEIPYYAINNSENNALYEKYLCLAQAYPNLNLLGRLAEYKYYNMDAIVSRALALADLLIKNEEDLN